MIIRVVQLCFEQLEDFRVESVLPMNVCTASLRLSFLPTTQLRLTDCPNKTGSPVTGTPLADTHLLKHKLVPR